MSRYVAFLRAVNVGGRVVKMDRLKQVFESIPLAGVSTFIASGNVLFDSRKLAGTLEPVIEKALRAALGYDVTTMIRSSAQLAEIVAHVERRQFEHGNGTMLYVGFLKNAPPAAAARSVAALSNDVDSLSVQGTQIYWQARKGFAESTVDGARLEKMLTVPVTLRNFNTVRKLADRSMDLR